MFLTSLQEIRQHTNYGNQGKMVSGSVDSAKVRELEQELNGIRSAFKDYIHNTREIESGFGQELGSMRKKNKCLCSSLGNQ